MKKQMYFNDMIFLSHGNKIIIKDKEGSKGMKYLTISELGKINYFNLYNRALRHGIHNFYKINSNIDCVIIKGKILFYENRNLINTLEINNGSRPLRKGVVYKEDYIIYSEYYGNKGREPIHVYKYNYINDKKEIVYTFNDIRHIHFIQEDINNSNYLYIGTGDLDDECGIYKFDLINHILQVIGGGSQMWRAVSLLQTNKFLYWGTDNPSGTNYIMRYNLESNRVEKLQQIDGPAYYSARAKSNEMYIATTIEDRKRHKAIIYRTLDGQNWDKYLEFKKDALHTKYFGYGLVEFINNQEELNELMYNLIGLKE